MSAEARAVDGPCSRSEVRQRVNLQHRSCKTRRPAFRLSPQDRLDRLWLLLEPTIITDVPPETVEEHIDAAREFIRERRARRHNRAANAMIDGWITLILGNEPTQRVRAFDIADGIDAEFEILRASGFSGISQ